MPASKIAYFVTPHGFGHAARSAAIIEALGRRDPDLVFEIVTTVPAWFFAQSLPARHRVRSMVTDVGLVQIDPFLEDLDATRAALESFWSDLGNRADRLIESWGDTSPRMVVSDISPLGLEVGHRLGVPSILVENFTWDWIYGAYQDVEPGLVEFAQRSAEATARATLHIQCEPVCRVLNGATQVGPVSRTARADRSQTRRALGLDSGDPRPMVLLTLGGMGWGSSPPDADGRCLFVALGGVDRLSREGSLLRLPNRSPIYPPDLVWAADAVVAKLGYSTVAECLRAGTRLGYIVRARFPESPVLEKFVGRNLPSIEFTPSRFREDQWSRSIDRLLALPAAPERQGNGAEQIADLVLELSEY